MFKDRVEAGKKLAENLKGYRNSKVVVRALPRGGVIPAREVAKELKAPLDLIITRKIGHPLSPEFAIGAVAEDGCIILTPEASTVSKEWLIEKIKREQEEACRRREVYLQDRQPISSKGKKVVLIDDGLATGLTMRAAIKELRHENPERIIVAVPVAPPDVIREISKEVDEVIALTVPPGPFGAIGMYYENFPPVSDEEVIRLLNKTNPL